MVGGVGHALVDLAGHLFDRPFALGEQVYSACRPLASAFATAARPSKSASFAIRSPIPSS